MIVQMIVDYFSGLSILNVYMLYVSRDFFFFKQKTAYEMRISDWSSDVCSSDLGERLRCPTTASAPGGSRTAPRSRRPSHRGCSRATMSRSAKIGRESCRERVCQYV